MKTAFVFAGQGSQKVGMLNDFNNPLMNEYPELVKLINTSTQEELNHTQNTQKAIVFTSLVIAHEVRKIIKPDAVLGLSLGEYSALTYAGVFSIDDVLEIVTQRGLFMQEDCEAIDSGMLAVIENNDTLKEIIKKHDVTIANLNSPKQTVLSGLETDLETLRNELKEISIRSIPLKVSGAFHSPYMQKASEKLNNLLSNYSFNCPNLPVICNVTTKAETDHLKERLVRHMISPVLFQQSIQNLIDQGFTQFIEIGPGTTCSTLIKQINPDVKAISINQISDLKEITHE